MSFSDLQRIISPKFTEQVLHQIISKKCELNDFKIDRIDIGGDESKKGDSYLSVTCRFKVYVNGKNKNNENEQIIVPVIVKYLPENLGRRKTYRSVDFFENEGIFYETVWPHLQQFQKSKNLESCFDNIPMYLYGITDGSHDFIALEDMSWYGYENMERGNGLDYQNTVNLLKLLAQFHGLSLACKHQNYASFNRIAKQLKETYFAEKYREWYTNFQGKLVAIARDAVAKELTSDYLAKFDRFIDGDLFGRLCKLCELNDHKLAVITHGDTWLPNFLFKYPEEKSQPPKIMMIDFQLTRYSILGNDLTFLLFTCIDMDVIEQKWDNLIVEYHKELVNSLAKFGTDPNFIKLEEIYDNIHESITVGVGMSMEGLVMSMWEDDQVADLDAIQGTEAVPIESVWLVSPLQDPKKRQRLARMIRFVVDKKLI